MTSKKFFSKENGPKGTFKKMHPCYHVKFRKPKQKDKTLRKIGAGLRLLEVVRVTVEVIGGINCRWDAWGTNEAPHHTHKLGASSWIACNTHIAHCTDTHV